MSHSNTQRMIDYWTVRRGQSLAPARAGIDPADFSDILTQAFIIGRERPGAYPFRLAGALLQDLHQALLRGADFMTLWTVGDRARLQAAVEAAIHRGEALTADVLGRSAQGHEVRLEMVLAPLTNAAGRIDRMLGLYQPVSPLFRLQNQPIERLFLRDIAFATGAATPVPLRIAAIDGRRLR